MRPDIFWIMTDEHRVDGVSAYGHGRCRTPNLDRLANDGVVFERAFCQAVACVPSRNSMMTGRYPHGAGNLWYDKSPDAPYWMDRLQDEAGYFTANFGKEGHYRPRSAFRVSEMNRRTPGHRYAAEGWPSRLGEQFRHLEHELGIIRRYTSGNPLILAGRNPLPAEKVAPAVLVDRGIEFIDHYHSDKPVLMRISMASPHTPVLPPEPYDRMYDPQDMDLPEDDVTDYRPSALERHWFHPLCGVHDMTQDEIRTWRAHYFGLCTYIDDQIGRFLDHLRDNWKRPYLVMFCSDHGNALGEFGLSEKFNFTSMSRQVPFIIAGHGIPAGKRVHELVELLDIGPTILHLLELDVADGCYDGRNLLPLMNGTADNWRDAVFTEIGPWSPTRLDTTSLELIDTEIAGTSGNNAATFIQRRDEQVTGHEQDKLWRPLLQCVQDDDFTCMARAIWHEHQGDDPQGGLYDLKQDPLMAINRFNDPDYAEVRARYLDKLQTWHSSTAREGRDATLLL